MGAQGRLGRGLLGVPDGGAEPDAGPDRRPPYGLGRAGNAEAGLAL